MDSDSDSGPMDSDSHLMDLDSGLMDWDSDSDSDSGLVDSDSLLGSRVRTHSNTEYKSTQKEIVTAKLKQSYGSKIGYLLQDNYEITESSPKALKDAKNLKASGISAPGSRAPPGALPLDPRARPRAPDPTRECSRYALGGRHFNI